MSFLNKIFGDPNEKFLKNCRPLLEQINSLEEKFQAFSSRQLKDKTIAFKENFKAGQGLDSFLAEAFALVRESAKRALNQRHYDVQLLGGLALHQGKIAEMKTGEGKTLASTLALYLNALEGRGAHLVTVNDYLARRDTVWMGQIYHLLGLKTGCLNHEQSFLYDPDFQSPSQEKEKQRDEQGGFQVVEDFLRPVERKEAYLADITYGTNHEFGFDYLRDNMVFDLKDKAQRHFHYAVIDEIDSILIDEARTPLIISQPDFESSKHYGDFARLMPGLKPEIDFTIDEKSKTASLTEKGIDNIERTLALTNIYTEKGIKYLHHLEQALRAKVFFKRDRDYIIKDGRVIIIDEFTGRLMPGRRYSGGLHQAIEAKEGVEVQAESKTLASITFQNYFKQYQKLAGMTGTAQTSAEEFDKVYGLAVAVIPTNKPGIRHDFSDRVYQTEIAKIKAAAEEVKSRHHQGQPVLVGTRSVDKNQYLSRLLKKEGVPHQVLNAKNHVQEGAIIAQAGRLGAVTIATNMAGRGVDIVLGGNPPQKEEAAKVKEIGGLHVLGTERHEARRIDNQLRGRAGRQGDPGSSQFFVSLEDDIMRIFGGGRIKSMMTMLKLPPSEPIEAKILSGALEKAQTKVEGMHFDLRKHLLEYDEVIGRHRYKIYSQRNDFLKMDYQALKNFVLDIIRQEISHLLIVNQEKDRAYQEIRTILPLPESVPLEVEALLKLTSRLFESKEKKEGPENFFKLLRFVILRSLDLFWTEHLDSLDYLKDSVALRAYGGKDPLVEFKTEAHRLFQGLQGRINSQIARTVFKLSFQRQQNKQ